MFLSLGVWRSWCGFGMLQYSGGVFKQSNRNWVQEARHGEHKASETGLWLLVLSHHGALS